MMTNKTKKLLSWVEIDRAALRFNFRVLKTLAKKNFRPVIPGSRSPAPRLLAVVKAGAYGHGMMEAARVLNKAGADVFGVSNVSEGVMLRQAGIRKKILLFENPLPEFAGDIVNYRLTPMLCTMELAKAVNEAAKKAGRITDVHIKIDTGMGRLGVWHEDAADFVERVSAYTWLRVCGLATHFPVADTDAAFTRRQFKILESVVQRLTSFVYGDMEIHAANSAGLAMYQNRLCNLLRPGLMVYGLYPNETIRRRVRLRPVMTIKSRVIFVKKIQPGQSISYGRTFIARRPMKAATIAIGYSDGYFRSLSNKSEVLIGGKRCRLLGRVTMDQIVVDVSAVKNVRLGQEAVILGRQGQAVVTAENLAQWAGTINYEITCNLGNRLPRIYLS